MRENIEEMISHIEKSLPVLRCFYNYIDYAERIHPELDFNNMTFKHGDAIISAAGIEWIEIENSEDQFMGITGINVIVYALGTKLKYKYFSQIKAWSFVFALQAMSGSAINSDGRPLVKS